jgi:O-antigen ligase
LKPQWLNKLHELDSILILVFFVFLTFSRRREFFYFNDINIIALYASDLVVILMLVALFIRLFVLRESKNIEKKEFKSIYYLIMGFILISMFFTTFSPRGMITKFNIYEFIKLFELFIVFLYFSTLNISLYKNWILKSFTISGLIQALIAIIQFVKQGSLGLKILGENVISTSIPGIAKIDTKLGKLIRPYGTFFHPNQLAAFLCVACATSIILLLTGLKDKVPRKQIFFYSLSTTLMILAEILTFSRAGIIALITNLALIFILSFKLYKNQLGTFKKTAALIIIAFILGFFSISPYISSRLTITDQSSVSRIYYDKLGLKIFAQNPLIGVGLGNIMPAMRKLGNFSHAWDIQPPHNYFIIVACETGILGLLLIIIIFGKLLWENVKKNWIGDNIQILFNIFLISSFIAMLFLMQFDHYFYTLQQTQLLLWAMLGIMHGNVLKLID